MMYLNLKNGLADGHELKQDSIHFLKIPHFDETIIKEGQYFIDSVNNMQSIIDSVRQVRD